MSSRAAGEIVSVLLEGRGSNLYLVLNSVTHAPEVLLQGTEDSMVIWAGSNALDSL